MPENIVKQWKGREGGQNLTDDSTGYYKRTNSKLRLLEENKRKMSKVTLQGDVYFCLKTGGVFCGLIRL
jgi:hypothetical protein